MVQGGNHGAFQSENVDGLDVVLALQLKRFECQL